MKVAILSDIHGNHNALEQVLNEATRKGVQKILVLGDFVGYYYHPDKVLRMLDSWDYETIQGNHEMILLQLMKGEMREDELRSKYGSGHGLALEKLSADQLEFLFSLPRQKETTIDGIRFLMCHGSKWDANYYLYPDTPLEILQKGDAPEFDFVLVGHSHYPFVHINPNSILINVGSVGQSRVRGGLANWTIINTESKAFEMVSTPYNPQTLIDEVTLLDPDIGYLKSILLRNNE